MKYKLINKTTKEEYLCYKVVIDGFDYYVSDEIVGFTYNKPTYNSDGKIGLPENRDSKKVIATTNSSIDVPKVVDEVKELALTLSENYFSPALYADYFILGYNKSQETHPFTEKDTIEFALYLSERMDEDGQILNPLYIKDNKLFVTKEELFQIWKEQRTVTIYCNNI